MLYNHYCHKEVLFNEELKFSLPQEIYSSGHVAENQAENFQDLNIMQPSRQTEKLFRPRNLPEGEMGKMRNICVPRDFNFEYFPPKSLGTTMSRISAHLHSGGTQERQNWQNPFDPKLFSGKAFIANIFRKSKPTSTWTLDAFRTSFDWFRPNTEEEMRRKAVVSRSRSSLHFFDKNRNCIF